MQNKIEKFIKWSILELIFNSELHMEYHKSYNTNLLNEYMKKFGFDMGITYMSDMLTKSKEFNEILNKLKIKHTANDTDNEEYLDLIDDMICMMGLEKILLFYVDDRIFFRDNFEKIILNK